MTPRVVVGVSGASGAVIAVRIVDLLATLGVVIDLVISSAAERTLAHEIDASAADRLRSRAHVAHAIDDIGATIASGSYPVAGMIVAPCSMRTLAAIAHSLSDNLLVRAADVQLKERRPLVLLARETPLHLGHLRAMTAVTEMGAVIMPPVPAFYRRPDSVEAIVDHIARRAIDQLRLGPQIALPWNPQ
ncbi:UbiX family flavin prenyltransferase [Phreatobacter sp. HK31-P]